jgi:hypothetical protein
LNELAHTAALKIMASKPVDNTAVLKSKIKKQINRALTNKRRHLAIKSNPDMREKVVNKMKRFRAKVKDGDKRPEKDDRMHPGLLSLTGPAWTQTNSGPTHPSLSSQSTHLSTTLNSSSLPSQYLAFTTSHNGLHTINH